LQESAVPVGVWYFIGSYLDFVCCIFFCCHPELVEGLLLDFGEDDFDNRCTSFQFSVNNACFFFLDQPFNCFFLNIACLISFVVSKYFNSTGLLS
jgi:hypothetical protein